MNIKKKEAMYELGLEQTNLENEMEAEARHGMVCVEKGGTRKLRESGWRFWSDYSRLWMSHSGD